MARQNSTRPLYKTPRSEAGLDDWQKTGQDTHHFVVYCGRYPSYSFAVPAVRRLRAREQGLAERDTGITFSFNHGVFDSVIAGLSEEEARLVKEHLQRSMVPPIWGVHIVENSVEVLGSDPAGRYECPLCHLRFSSQSGFVDHVGAGHGQHADLVERDLEQAGRAEGEIFELGGSNNG